LPKKVTGTYGTCKNAEIGKRKQHRAHVSMRVRSTNQMTQLQGLPSTKQAEYDAGQAK
jgi:hypothetical protein